MGVLAVVVVLFSYGTRDEGRKKEKEEDESSY
jgi:hypothetical protein